MAASEPASGKGQALRARISELRTENEQLSAELQRRKTLKADLAAIGDARASDARPAASSAAPVPTLAQTVAEPDVSTPLLTEEQFFARYPGVPYGQYAVYAGRYAARAEFAALQQQQAQQAVAQRWTALVAPVRAQLPDYDAVVSTAFSDLPDTPTNTVLADAIQRSEMPELLYAIADPEIRDRLMALPPSAALLELGAIKGALRGSAPPSPRSFTTSAPAPPTTLGRKAADTGGDELTAAVKANDVARFRAERLRRAAARLK